MYIRPFSRELYKKSSFHAYFTGSKTTTCKSKCLDRDGECFCIFKWHFPFFEFSFVHKYLIITGKYVYEGNSNDGQQMAVSMVKFVKMKITE